jgi:acyl-CoA synthetase (AMP-forming)/AMP-acid ligase II
VIQRSPYPDVEIPEVALHALVLGGARARGAHPALIDAGTGATLTYAQLADAVDALAGGLHSRGLQRGEVAAICAPNRIEWPVAAYAVARLGGAVTTINPAFTDAEMQRQLADSGAVIAFTTPELAPRFAHLREVFEFGSVWPAGSPPPAAGVDPAHDVVALPYSSGTTGTPKGVMLTHRNLVAMQLLMGPVEGTTERDVTAACLPFFHIYGFSVILALGLYRGATLVVFPRFEMEPFLAAVQRYRITRLPLVPPLLLRLAREPRVAAYDTSSVRAIISGAAPLAPALAEEVSRRFGCLVKQGYGLTELSPGSHMHPEDRGTPPPGSVGLLHPNTECRLVEGEIWIRGPQVMKGYLNQPAATAAMITEDGWLRTGDVGRVDAEGYLYVVDRLKELIKYKGFQVAPAELEALLLTHPAIADAAVIPRPDPEAGEVPKAFVVKAPGAEITADELMAYVAARVAGYKKIRAVEFVAEIPKSPAGKILRRVLVERERAAAT